MILEFFFFPLTYLSIFIIYLYKLFISPAHPGICRYTPTCSSYAITALKRFGFIRGWAMAIKRIIRCNPKSKGGYDPVKDNIKGEIKWLI